jgi:hypothetical protein
VVLSAVAVRHPDPLPAWPTGRLASLPMIADMCRWWASTIDVEAGWRGGPTYRVSTVADGCAFGYRAAPVGAIVVVIPAFAWLTTATLPTY